MARILTRCCLPFTGQASVIWLLQATGEAGKCSLYSRQYYSGKTPSFYFQGKKRERVLGVSASLDWAPGCLHHLCAFWAIKSFLPWQLLQMSGAQENSVWPLGVIPAPRAELRFIARPARGHLLEVRAPASPTRSPAPGASLPRAQGALKAFPTGRCAAVIRGPSLGRAKGWCPHLSLPPSPGRGSSRGLPVRPESSSKSQLQASVEAGQGRGREGLPAPWVRRAPVLGADSSRILEVPAPSWGWQGWWGGQVVSLSPEFGSSWA